MKYICLGSIERGNVEGMSDNVTENTVGSSGSLSRVTNVQGRDQKPEPKVYKHSRRVQGTFAASITICG